MHAVVAGALLLGYWAIGVCFSRFWRTSGDRLFGFFAIAFWLLAVERLLLILVAIENEMRPYVYMLRLVAFLFIVYAILDKNRGSRRRN
jgi:hypothetical protein